MKNFSRAKNILVDFKKIALNHKIISIILLVSVIYGIYYGYGKFTNTSAETRYVLVQAEKGTIVVSVSASGQISASNQLDLKSKASGDVIYIPVKEGQQVKAGALIAQLDSSDAEKSVRDAQANLESARLSLEKLKQPADALSLLQAENSLEQANQSKNDAQDNLAKAYDDGFNSVANAFIDLPGVMSGLDNVLNGATITNGQTNAYAYYDLIKNYANNADKFRDASLSSYQTARSDYDKNLEDYKNASRYSDSSAIEALISETYNTTKSISEAIKNTKSFLDLVNDTLVTNSSKNIKTPSALSAHENNVQAYTGTTNNHLGDLLNIKNSIENYKNAITNASRSIAEKTESLAKLKSGADPLDVQSQELSVKQKENALLDARENLSNYFVRAPFDGIIAKLNVKKGDSASSNMAIATLITSQQIAEISLNEVDVAKIKIGQKATLTFDAAPDLIITGQVIQIDTIGTISQGVVTYSAEIALDTQDDRIKPGMSVSSAIITDVKQDVVYVPNSAVKSQGGRNYVEILEGIDKNSITPTSTNQGITSKISPKQINAQIGLSNDTITEITSGISQGDYVVSRTITASTQTAQTTQQSSSIRIPGLGR